MYIYTICTPTQSPTASWQVAQNKQAKQLCFCTNRKIVKKQKICVEKY